MFCYSNGKSTASLHNQHGLRDAEKLLRLESVWMLSITAEADTDTQDCFPAHCPLLRWPCSQLSLFPVSHFGVPVHIRNAVTTILPSHFLAWLLWQSMGVVLVGRGTDIYSRSNTVEPSDPKGQGCLFLPVLPSVAEQEEVTWTSHLPCHTMPHSWRILVQNITMHPPMPILVVKTDLKTIYLMRFWHNMMFLSFLFSKT